MYIPGLSARKRSTTYPLLGTAIVSFCGGRSYCRCSRPLRSRSKACFKLIFFTLVSGDRPIPITLNEYPCKWKGWLRLGCWTMFAPQKGNNYIILLRAVLLSILTFIDKHNFNDSIQWNVDLVRAHTVWSAVCWTVISVAELFRIDFVVLGNERCRCGQV